MIMNMNNKVAIMISNGRASREKSALSYSSTNVKTRNESERSSKQGYKTTELTALTATILDQEINRISHVLAPHIILLSIQAYTGDFDVAALA
jgi:hypothetical protein